jgi:hypothetical protein
MRLGERIILIWILKDYYFCLEIEIIWLRAKQESGTYIKTVIKAQVPHRQELSWPSERL